MVIRLCADQINKYWNIINDTIDASFPESAIKTKNSLLRDLTLDMADCWFQQDESGETNLVLITRFNDDYVVGRKTFSVLAVKALRNAGPEVFLECFEVGKRYAQNKDCEFIDFYSDNPKILEYARMFNIFWESTYIQFKLSDN